MVKLTAGVLFVTVASILASNVVQNGCRDAGRSLTQLDYYPIRDMRRTVALTPQKGSLRAPDSLSVPVGGREWMPSSTDELMANREAIGARFPMPAANDSSVVRGGRDYGRLCAPCHGASLKGDGPVAARFMPPPDLLNATGRGRSDGYLFTYIRYGSAIMPKYGHALTVAETWDVVHYLRHQQKVSPR